MEYLIDNDEKLEMDLYYECLAEEHELCGNEDSVGVSLEDYNRGF